MQEVEVWPFEQMVYAQPRICPREWDTQTPLGFWDTNELPNLGQTTRSHNNQWKRELSELSEIERIEIEKGAKER